MSESNLQRSIQKVIEEYGGYCVKYHGNAFSVAGTPDLLCCIGGKFVGIEVKVAGESATRLQLQRGEEIKKAGGLFYVVHSVRDVRSILDTLL